MKLRPREINIFSLSALDMFCSALGAFMFLALIFIAFAPNLGPKSEVVAQLRAKVAELTQSLEQTTQERDEAKQQLQDLMDQNATDVAIVIDTTGSMQDPISGLRTEIADLAQILSKLTRNTRIAIVEYRDVCMSESIRTLSFTPADASGVARLQGFANQLQPNFADCNLTPPEQVAMAIETATRLDWKAPPARRYIVVIGDSPAYPNEVQGSIATARAWGDAGSKLSTLVVSPANQSPTPDALDYYRNLAQAGRGTSLAPGASFALSVLKAMAG